VKLKLLVILPRFPYPLEKGDKLRAFHQIKNLANSFEITLCAISDHAISQAHKDKLLTYCTDIEIIRLYRFQIYINLIRALLFGRLPLQVAWFFNRRGRSRIRRIIRDKKPDRIFCQLIRTSEYVRDIKNVPKTLDYMDVFSKGMDRRQNLAPWYLKWVFRLEYRRLLKYEHAIFDHFDEKVIISAQDRDLIVHPHKNNIEVIANGVDTEFFHPIDADKDFDILFNGNMNYPPNVEAVEFLVRDILPLVHDKYPETRLLISGASPSSRVKVLRSSHVVISGWVDDIRYSFARSRMMVAPMLISIGLQNKLLEAMAMKIPCITTPLANNALKANEGSDILVGSSAKELADNIVFLLENPAAQKEIGEKGYHYAVNNFNWQSVSTNLAEVIGRSAQAHP